jgi:putative transposase
VRYAFIKVHRPQFAVRAMCRMLCVHPSGFYAWLKNPLSKRAVEDQRQTALLREAWQDSGKVYGYRKLHDDLRDQGETCCPNRVARLAKLAGIRAQIGYKRRTGTYGGKPSVAIDNTLDRQFDVDAPDKAWVTDITYIKTHEGFAYLAVVIDLYARKVVGWAMQSRQTTDLVLQALLMAVWRRKPKHKVLIHSDQGSQFTSMDWASAPVGWTWYAQAPERVCVKFALCEFKFLA